LMALSHDSLIRLKGCEAKSGLSIYALRLGLEQGNKFSADGLPICRIAIIEVLAPVESVAEAYEDMKARVEWDTSCAESKSVPLSLQSNSSSSSSGGVKVHYTRGKAGWLVPAREFLFLSGRVPPALLGLPNYNALIIVHKDYSDDDLPASSLLPKSLTVVRGKQNSMLVLEPISANRTKVTYLVEADAKGMIASLLPASLVDFLAGDGLVLFLSSLKARAEDKDEDESLSIEEIARRRFEKKLAKENSKNRPDLEDVLASKAELLEMEKMMVKRIATLQSPDDAALRKRIEHDLKKTRENLKRAK